MEWAKKNPRKPVHRYVLEMQVDSNPGWVQVYEGTDKEYRESNATTKYSGQTLSYRVQAINDVGKSMSDSTSVFIPYASKKKETKTKEEASTTKPAKESKQPKKEEPSKPAKENKENKPAPSAPKNEAKENSKPAVPSQTKQTKQAKKQKKQVPTVNKFVQELELLIQVQNYEKLVKSIQNIKKQFENTLSDHPDLEEALNNAEEVVNQHHKFTEIQEQIDRAEEAVKNKSLATLEETILLLKNWKTTERDLLVDQDKMDWLNDHISKFEQAVKDIHQSNQLNEKIYTQLDKAKEENDLGKVKS